MEESKAQYGIVGGDGGYYVVLYEIGEEFGPFVERSAAEKLADFVFNRMGKAEEQT